MTGMRQHEPRSSGRSAAWRKKTFAISGAVSQHADRRRRADPERGAEHAGGERAERPPIRLPPGQFGRGGHAQAARDERGHKQNGLEHAVKHAEAGHRLRGGKAEQPQARGDERRVHRLHQRGDEAHARQRQGEGKQLAKNRPSSARALGKEHEPRAEQQHQNQSGGFARERRGGRNCRAEGRRPAAQAVNQPNAQQRADKLLKQLAEGGRNRAADAVIIAVQHAGRAENRDTGQEAQQRGQRFDIAQPQAQRLTQEKRQRGEGQTDGQRQQQRAAHDARPLFALRLGAQARNGGGQTRDDRRDEQHLRALRQLDKPHRLRAQFTGEP